MTPWVAAIRTTPRLPRVRLRSLALSPLGPAEEAIAYHADALPIRERHHRPRAPLPIGWYALIDRWSGRMKDDHDYDDSTPGLRSKLMFRAEAEAAWLRGSASGNGDQAQPASPGADARRRRIREAAYFKAEQRGFAPGHELEDWLAAEAALNP